MSDADQRPSPAPAADEGVKTDQQIWDEMDAGDGADTLRGAVRADPSGGADFDDPDDPDAPDSGEDATPGGDAVSTDPAMLQAQKERLEHSLKSEKGRTAASRREAETLRAQLAEARSRAPGKPIDKTLQANLDKARTEYGDVVGPVADVIAGLTRQIESLTARDTAETAANQRRLDAIVAEQEVLFESEHPDGFDTIIANRAAFDEWIEDQPKAMRETYAANAQAIVDGTGAALLVARFKQALQQAHGSNAPANPSTTRLSLLRQRQLDGARSPRGSSAARTSSQPDPDSDDAQAWWDHYDRLDREKAARK